jgi:hypothetical protein
MTLAKATRELLEKEGLLPRLKRGRRTLYATDEERLEALRKHRKEARERYDERLKVALAKLSVTQGLPAEDNFVCSR